MKTTAIAFTVAVATGLLTACGGAATPAPTVTVTQQADPAPEVTVTQKVPGPTVTVTEKAAPDTSTEVTEMALGMAWAEMSASDQASICFLYGTDPGQAWEYVVESAPGLLTRNQFETFFNSACR